MGVLIKRNNIELFLVFLFVFVLGICVAVLYMGEGTAKQSSETILPSPVCKTNDSIVQAGNNDGMKIVFKDDSFSFEFLRAITGTDIGEGIMTARRIKDGDFESWYSEWYATASRVQAIADDVLSKGHDVSAREAYLRASNYYRSAEFYLHGNPSDPRIRETANKSRYCFRKAIELLPSYIEPVEIPYENTTLPAYFYSVDGSAIPRPTIIIQTGYDGTQEELYYEAIAANERGYNALTFEGPGQGSVIREQGLPFRADWENVIIPVVDYLISRPDVKTDRIALYGISLGGYFTPRAAAFEHRIAALIANGGVFDPLEPTLTNMKISSRDEMATLIAENPESLNSRVRKAMNTSTSMRWFFDQGMYTFKAATPSEFLLKYSLLTMSGFADKITCPTLVIDSESDHMLAGQPEKLYENLKSEKTFILFKADEGAGEHCQEGAVSLSNQRIFDWLDETFARMDG